MWMVDKIEIGEKRKKMSQRKIEEREKKMKGKVGFVREKGKKDGRTGEENMVFFRGKNRKKKRERERER